MMQKVNVYDFDDTIYNGDSSRDFYFYCLIKYKKLFVLQPLVGFYGLLFLLKIYPKTKFKQRVFAFLKWIPDIDNTLKQFWDEHMKNIKDFYIATGKSDDIIISASPEFLLEPAIKAIGDPNLIGSKIDKYTGRYDGLNCYGKEKVARLKKEFPEVEINEFYSDSRSDSPLADLAEQAYLVIGDKLEKW